MLPTPLIAVDVGNSRIKLGLFRCSVGTGLPEPENTLHLTGRLPEFDQLHSWLKGFAQCEERNRAAPCVSVGTLAASTVRLPRA